ncbi:MULTISPECIES: hypothetical protein [unclassified Chryseobacterium]|uniref:hypothetical protein n=1 Tax=unclassified Chryseobacterium TaxID=2593645 RepID=UPI00103E8F85|nr:MULTISPECIES: hypothetical protein [unclassified Chryseobacterium]
MAVKNMMIVDIRKFDLDSSITDLVKASEIRKTWYGKITDTYWDYLNKTTTNIDCKFYSHLFSDLLVYFIDEKGIKLGLRDYGEQISKNRNHAVFIFALDDKENILNLIKQENFTENFEVFCKDLNGSFYSYTRNDVNETLKNFKNTLSLVDQKIGLILNIG